MFPLKAMTLSKRTILIVEVGMNTRDKRVISTWQVVVYDNCVSFKRVDNGQMQESYPPVPLSKAAVYAAAIVHGLQPPRDLRVCDKPIG